MIDYTSILEEIEELEEEFKRRIKRITILVDNLIEEYEKSALEQL